MFFQVPFSLRGVYMLPQRGRRGPEANLGNGEIAVGLAKPSNGCARERGMPLMFFKPVVGYERRAKQPLIMFTR